MINIICFGDSITAGSEFPVAARWTSLLQNKLDTAKAGVFTVHNKGIGGDTTANGFDRLGSDVLTLLPGVVLIQFGFNDANINSFSEQPRVSLAEFERNIREFCRIIIENNSMPVLIVNHSIGNIDGKQGNGKTFNENAIPYSRIIRELAKENKVNVIDIPLQMSIRNIATQDFVAGDQIHLALNANPHYADIIYQGLNDLVLPEK